MTYYISIIQTIWKLLPIALIILLGILFFSWRSERQKVNDFKEMQQAQSQEIKKWKDKAGKNRARAEIAEINARHTKTVMSKELQLMLKREVGNIKRNLISYSSVKASTQGNLGVRGKDTIYKIDEKTILPAKQFGLQNPDLDFEGVYVPQLDTLMANYKIIHNFDVFYYYKKPGKAPWNLFRRRRAVAEIKFHNYGSQADSLFTLVMERRKGFFKRFLGKK
ncbi:hypothetical protein NBT05_02710 [Aquimarina sp. ERC-38]|uniref:hypothetical protein n=1 Tax=Aquimarina sp. ERC-38 TaxID=2949996 RepID=UPI002246A73C|nr:hypothetical protein [Aquimarina sp. ERC-38]UZO81392.1 hypothetical protein NBT05_02710 [Aquimarina sp. ERC-38]